MEEKKIKEILGSDLSKSKKMLELYNGGLEIKEISKLMGVRYNFVYNVVSGFCMKNGVEVRVGRKNGSVKEEIIRLLKEGKEIKEISKELGKDYNYIWKVRKEWELSGSK